MVKPPYLYFGKKEIIIDLIEIALKLVKFLLLLELNNYHILLYF